MQPDGVNLWYFKRLYDLRELFIVWISKGIRHRVAKIYEWENHRLWQNAVPLDSFGQNENKM